MMLFGQSVFQSVLERLKAESEAAEPASYRIRGLSSGFVADALENVSVGASRMHQSYLDNAGEDVPPPEPEIALPPVMPEHLARTAPQDVSAELAISEQDTLHSLGEKRRTFAKANHPDGVHPDFRDKANTRMMIANLLIDEAIRRVNRR